MHLTYYTPFFLKLHLQKYILLVVVLVVSNYKKYAVTCDTVNLTISKKYKLSLIHHN